MITAFHYNPSSSSNEMEDAGVKASLRVENDSHATSARRCLTVHIKYCQSWSKWSMLGLQGCSAICWARSKNRSNSEPLSYFVFCFFPFHRPGMRKNILQMLHTSAMSDSHPRRWCLTWDGDGRWPGSLDLTRRSPNESTGGGSQRVGQQIFSATL